MPTRMNPFHRKLSGRWLLLMLAFMVIGIMGANGSGSAAGDSHWHLFNFLTDPAYSFLERFALILNVIIALGGLYYAYMLIQEVYRADTGTPRMQEIARAVREGAMAYLRRQFTTVAILIAIITVVLVMTANPHTEAGWAVPIGRGFAFLMGSIFSATVGFVGMYLATDGNLRVAAAARDSFGKALQIGYRTGTITGMLTDGLGLLGGSLIFLAYGERAYEALLGFGFGGTLLALFMRVGGGIYTKAADVGADLVGKIEKDIPEDDPRNAATIADNVGDNVGDCAGMAADIFESYEVTIVAAMILGYASFGHKGVIFPLLVRAIGVIGSIISTYSVRTGDSGDVNTAMRAVNRGFWLGSIISIGGFMTLGLVYLRFDEQYIVNQAVERGMYSEPGFVSELNKLSKDAKVTHEGVLADAINHVKKEKAKNADKVVTLLTGMPALSIKAAEEGLKEARADQEKSDPKIKENAQNRADAMLAYIGAYRAAGGKAWRSLTAEQQIEISKGKAGDTTIASMAQGYVPLQLGLDMRAAWTCLIGIILAVALNFCTEYWTSTEYEPVKSLAKSCRTGHATNIIQGIAVGYESTVWAVIIIAAAILGSVLIYSGTTPVFIAFGVAMCGIGMLTLTGNTISMDVFGPVADNANGIGEMGYDRDDMGEENYKRARQILADLDAVGNTTKAETKGIAIGSAVIAAVSLFASFIAVIAVGSEDKITTMTTAQYLEQAGKLTVADPMVFIGFLLGGAVPFLFSSMLIRAVGRAAFLIVKECRIQFKDKLIWLGEKKPDYGKVVDICTTTAQKELVGPGFLAIFTPLMVGFILGPYALGGFLAGMILVGQLLAVFMSNAGGAWDNAKKMIEDGVYGGKGSEAHKASVTGDTVGDPLKDTAGPAVNPLIKVMNMVALLGLGLVLKYNVVGISPAGSTVRWVGAVVALICFAAIAWAVWQSKRESEEMKEVEGELTGSPKSQTRTAVPN